MLTYHLRVSVSAWQSLPQAIMAMLSTQSTRNAQVLPLQQPAAPAVLPTEGTKAHCMSSSTQAYADSEEGVSVGVECWCGERGVHILALPPMKPQVLSGARR